MSANVVCVLLVVVDGRGTPSAPLRARSACAHRQSDDHHLSTSLRMVCVLLLVVADGGHAAPPWGSARRARIDSPTLLIFQQVYECGALLLMAVDGGDAGPPGGLLGVRAQIVK
jgi:hypothetical protein